MEALASSPTLLAAHLLGFKMEERQALLEEAFDPMSRLDRLLRHLKAENEILQVERKIKSRVKKQMEKSQKEYYLNEQMQAIQKEFGEKDEFKSELQSSFRSGSSRRTCRGGAWSASTPRAAQAQDDESDVVPRPRWSGTTSTGCCRCLGTTYARRSLDDLDLHQEVLDEDHYGLEKAKERILEQLAVAVSRGPPKGPILCLVGPPAWARLRLVARFARATGRTSCGRPSAACATRRRFAAIAAPTSARSPARSSRAFVKAGTSNPVFLLDEIDKMSTDFRGDPSAALLEVLDPEQNEHFVDHYLDLDYDLSQVMFLCTANSLQGIPEALRDRLEIIEASWLHRGRKARHCPSLPHPQAGRAQRPGVQNVSSAEAVERMVQQYTRERACVASSASWPGVSQGRRQVVEQGADDPIEVTAARSTICWGFPGFTEQRLEDTERGRGGQGPCRDPLGWCGP